MSLAHDLNAIERHDKRLAWGLEDSLDFAWARMGEDGGTYFRQVLEMIRNAALRCEAV